MARKVDPLGGVVYVDNSLIREAPGVSGGPPVVPIKASRPLMVKEGTET